MDEGTFIIDPNSDTTLTLHYTDAPFAPWSDKDLWPNHVAGDLNKVKFESSQATESQVFDSEAAESQTVVAISDDASQDEEKPHQLIAHYRVSSKHLILASPVFKSMLTGPWKENKSEKNSEFRISTTDFDVDALHTLMNIIHGRNRSVPKSVTLEMLAKFAVVVDYYDCHEAVEHYVDLWLKEIHKEVTHDVYDRNLILWAFISLVFPNPDIFSQTTETALYLGRGPFHSLGLPFSQAMLDAFEKTRQKRVNQGLTMFFEIAEGLREDNKQYGCCPDCCSTLLGAIIRHMYKKNIYDPRPSAPFIGLCCRDISEVRRSQAYATLGTCPLKTCGLAAPLSAKAKLWKQHHTGMDVTEFLPPSRVHRV